MSRKHFVSIISLILLVLVSCSKQTVPSQQSIEEKSRFTPIEISDYAGRAISLEKAAERIVVMADNALVVVKQLGAIDKVVALDSKTKGYLPLSLLNETNPKLNDLPDVGKTKSPNYEYIISLSPDLILFKGDGKSCDVMQEKTGVPTACIISKDGLEYSDLYFKIGMLLGMEKQEAKVNLMMAAKEEELKEMLSEIEESQRKSAYIVVQNSKGSHFKTLKQSLSLELARINNVASDANKVDEWGFAEISKEEFMKYEPDMVFLDMPVSESSIQKEDLLSDPTFNFLDAVKHDRVFHTHTFSLPKDYAYVFAEAYYYAHLAYPETVTQDIYEKALNDIFDTTYGISGYYESWKASLD